MYDLHLEHGNNGGGFTCLAFAALRGVIQQSKDFFIKGFGRHFEGGENETSCDSTSNSATSSPYGDASKLGYDIFLNMVKHTDMLSFEDKINRIVLGVFLMNCMESTGYLDPTNTTLTERIYFSRLALEFYNVILSNNHSISFLVPPNEGDDDNVELKK